MPREGGFGLGLSYKGGNALLMTEKLIVVQVELRGSGDISFAEGLLFLHDAMQPCFSGANTEPNAGHYKR